MAEGVRPGRPTTVAITGDHGEETRGMLAYDSTLRVPMVIRQPGRDAGTIDQPLSLVDLSGTLLTLANVAAPPPMHSASMPHGSRDVYAETLYPRTAGWHAYGLVDQRSKLIASSEAELYDLQNDPGETRNVASDRTTLATSMRTRAAQLVASATASETKASAAARERLSRSATSRSPRRRPTVTRCRIPLTRSTRGTRSNASCRT